MRLHSSNPSRIRSVTAGFTLIEMMVTIAVIAILASMAMPSFQSMIERNRVAGLINQFSGAFMHARNEAVTRNKRVVVCKSANPQAAAPTCETSGNDWRNGWLVFIDEDGNSNLNGTDMLLRVGQTSLSGYAINQPQSVAWVAFSADGVARFHNGVANAPFTVVPPSGIAASQRRMTVDPVGRVRVADAS